MSNNLYENFKSLTSNWDYLGFLIKLITNLKKNIFGQNSPATIFFNMCKMAKS